MPSRTQRGLGTFLGVYTPTILTILGVIMYLRLGWVTGHLGLWRTLAIVCLANSITLITTLSFSSMATNMRVGAGGAYFIISRSLGLGVGAAVGIPLYLSQAVSVTLYAFGLSEALRMIWPGLPLGITTTIVILAVTAVSFYGARFALTAQIPLLILVGLSIAALVLGVAMARRIDLITVPLPLTQLDFWAGFAIFFPAVTGVMAGLSLSGDLKDPGRAIPIGAIAATLTGFAVYLTIPILLTKSASATVLQEDSLVWLKIAPLGALLVFPGLLGAILSSAIGSILGAPRTLQAVMVDQLDHPWVRRFIAGTNGERTALFLSMGIALLCVYLGDLNAVAQVVTMFFLTVYGTINVVAGLETLSGDPSWRPKFRIPALINIGCGIACLWTMLLISPIAGLVALAIEVLLWLGFTRREQRATWGDSRRGLYEVILRWALVRLARRPMSARNWRPHVIVFVDDPAGKLDLIRYGSWFSQNRGVVTVCELIVGEIEAQRVSSVERLEDLSRLMSEEKLTVFPEVDIVDNVIDGIVDVTQANGIAGFSSNTILLGWPSDVHRMAEILVTARRLEHLNKSVVIGRIRPDATNEAWQQSSGRIDIWWGGLKQNGDLMLLLAFLLTRNHEWRDAEIRILSAASNEFARGNTDRYLRKLLTDIRIQAECEVFIRPQGRPIADLVSEYSSDSDAVFLGLATPEEGEELEYVERLNHIAGDLPVVFLVKNSCLFVGTLLQPENLAGLEQARRESDEETD